MTYEYQDGNPGYMLSQVQILRATNEPCIVCGHPTGDCAGENSAPDHIWGTSEVPSLVDQNMVLVEKDVIEWRQITPFTKSKVLVARAGQQIPFSRAQELGIA
jgi:hypothetical protein